MKGLFIGLTTIDVLYPLLHFPKENEKIRATDDHLDLGGPAMNAAFAFAALGGEATLITWIGRHAWTNFMKTRLENYGIETIDLNANQERDPVVSAILINMSNGTRTIVTSQVEMNIEIVPPAIKLDAFEIICVDGFFGAYTIGLLQKNVHHIPVVFDGGSHKAHTDQILSLVNYPIFSGHFKAPKSRTIQDYLTQFNHRQYAITQGEHPILFFDKGTGGSIRPNATTVVDTLAAGDLFHGAFAKYILENNFDFPSALREAADIATASCQYIGARKWAELL